MVGELEWDDKLLEVLRSFSGVSMVCARRDGKCCHDFIELFRVYGRAVVSRKGTKI
jgi:hypothetical protein